MDDSLERDDSEAGFGAVLGNIGKFARGTTAHALEGLVSLKDAAGDTVQKLTAKKTDAYEGAIIEYNSAFTMMNDNGHALLRQRERSTDAIDLIEQLINSIANTPKSFTTAFSDIARDRAEFVEAEEFARKDLEAARASALGAGAGLTAGAAVAGIAPTAAMWVATTFGTASTGTAISTLSGAAATNAALAWLGGGALATSGGGMAAGSALLALAGPVGWTIVGATLFASIVLFTKKKFASREAKQNALTAVKENTSRVRQMDAEISDLLARTRSLRESLLETYRASLTFHDADFRTLTTEQQAQLATLVNNATACAALLGQRIEQDDDD